MFLTDPELLRYSRHILLTDWGVEAQEALKKSRVLIIGVGGLGCMVAQLLASAGVGFIKLIDNDEVELSNLQRQILHDQNHVGMSKVDSAKTRLAAINSLCYVETVKSILDTSNIATHTESIDLVIDCSDNFQTRHLINQFCVNHQKTLLSGAASQYDGQIFMHIPNVDSACYACIYPTNALIEEASCRNLGVFSPIVSIIGSYQASEALKYLTKFYPPLKNTLLLFDALENRLQKITVPRNQNCEVCLHHTHKNQDNHEHESNNNPR